MKKIIVLSLLLFTSLGILKAQQRDRDRIRQEDHYQYLDGQLFQYRNGTRTQVMEQQRLKNGTLLNPDGSYLFQNQERFQLRQGECLDFNGLLYKNQNMFNKGKPMSNNKMIQRQKRELIQKRSPNTRGTMSSPKRGGARRGAN